jgi:chitinase
LSSVFPKMAENAKGRRNFAKNCVGLVREYGFDGIDISWEFPGYEPHNGTPNDGKNFVLLLNEVRSALDAYQSVAYPNGDKTFGLTAALPCIPGIIDSQDIEGVNSILTEMNLFSFDMHGTWDDKVGVNAPLYDQDPKKFKSPGYSLDGCVARYLGDGADPYKINVGLPFYGRSFGGAKKLYGGHSGPDSIHWWSDEGQPQYSSILEALPEMISLRDDTTQTQWAYFDDQKGGLVSFDDNQAVCNKVAYAQEKDLHGYIVWDLSGDLTEALATPLLDVVNMKLQRGDHFDCGLLRAESRDENGKVVVVDDAAPDPWYADWSTGTCVNDGKQSAWEKEENLFRFKEECCGDKFEYKFDICVGPPTYKPSAIPTYMPSSSPFATSQPTDEPTSIFGAAQVIGTDPITTRVAEEMASTVSEPDPNAPVTWCKGGCKNSNEKCVGNQNHPQGVDDETCKACDEGQTFWPCDVNGLCFCWDPDTPRIPPAPASGRAQLSEERPCEYFTEDIFNLLAPEAQFPYTYEGFCLAVDHYNDGHAEKIFMMGTEDERKKELAAFLGHTLHESDEWKAAREYLMCADNKEVDGETFCKPCTTDEFDWDNFKCTGVGLAGGGLTFNGYCDFVIQPPLACPCNDTLFGDEEGYVSAKNVFFGRGAIQTSWNYNYRAASEALAGDASLFCDNPDLVATEPEYAWGAGVFFWMENLKEETTCHIESLRSHDFGGTLNNINGGLECPAYHGGWHGEAIKLRLNRYCKSSAALGLDSIMVFDGCKGLNTSFAECLGDGTCPDCDQFSDGTQPIAPTHHDAATTTTATEGLSSTLASDSSSKTTPSPSVTSDVSTLAPVESQTDTPAPVASTHETPAPVADDNQTTPSPISSSTGCSEGLFPVDGLPGCCVPEPAYLVRLRQRQRCLIATHHFTCHATNIRLFLFLTRAMGHVIQILPITRQNATMTMEIVVRKPAT